MMDLLGQLTRKFKHSKKLYSRSRYSNSNLAYGGYTPTSPTTATQFYDSTSWTSVPTSLTTARAHLGSTTTSSTAALAFGGLSGPSTIGSTEIYTDAGPATKTITVS
jgi:hypothetical protein